MTNANPRAVILDILLEVLENGRLSHLAIRDKLSDNAGLSKQERAFITRVSEGTIERCIELDYIVNQYSKVKVKKMKPVIRNILRMSVYQLKYMDSVPDCAVCNEAVKLTAKRGYFGLKGFVNGILRNIIREPERCSYDENDSVKYSMPQWIIDMWTEEYGIEKTKKMLENSCRENSLCIRWNRSKCGREEFLKMLEKDSVKYRQSEISQDIFYLDNVERLEDMNAFQTGFFQVQDMSSAMAGYAAAVKEGDICIDVCAAPGGKTIHLADMLNETGCVYAGDISEQKVEMIRENVKRTGFLNVKLKVWDASKDDITLHERADVVMADLPCSGLGVMSRKSDIKYKVTQGSIEELVQLQRKILSVVSAYVKPTGILIYSTCTVNKKENDSNVRWILEHLPFELESLEGKLPAGLQYDSLKEGYVQIFPGDYGMDGFFVAAFRKKQKD